ncbi:MAG: hypothetical protein GAK40_00273 [Burkholderia plantarii]|nr:MAG: hypothetical protein GAK40_00273 [Burkholderia plantarii]
MPLATRCPHCETVFRIQPEHLTLHGGLARCGHCREVFDAAHSLVDPDPTLAPAIVETAPAADGAPQPPRVFSATAPHATPEQPVDGSFTPGAWDMWAPWLDGSGDPRLRHNSRNTHIEPLVPVGAAASRAVPANEAGAARGAMAPASAADPAAFGQAPLESLPVEPAAASAESTDSADSAIEPPPAEPVIRVHAVPREDSAHGTAQQSEPFATEPAQDGRVHFAMTRESPAAPSARRGLRALGWVLALLLVVTLAGQLAWWQHETLIARWPASQPLFSQLCASLGCTVTPPRDIDSLRLGEADLRQLDGPRVLELKIPLTNRATLPVAYPSLALTLLDGDGHLTARRVLTPADYVAPAARIGAGVPPGATQTLFARIDTTRGAANGQPGVVAARFSVQIFYP